ncbi:hypothetical protein CFC21_013874 [Triticum aestivum]|uniref:DUF4220 domain-containing protein n=2 Tax=Triticum aestivum TaxID=4565 RepID=A0A9R1IYI3_WHEAT|nr:hypothetical protein CFC21_013874 [Triticum aestivum]
MAVIAGLGTYGHHYRHHPLIRFLYLGAITLFLPIVSDVVSTIPNPYTITVYPKHDRVILSNCEADGHVFLVILWIGLVQIVGANATTIVASDSREGRSIAPSAVQLVKAIWTSYLAYMMIESGLEPYGYNVKWSQDRQLSLLDILLLALPYALILSKLLLKYYAWYKASRSLAFGRNPRLIVGYMEKLQVGTHYAELAISEHDVPPPLIVMGEDTVLVEKQPHGYSLAGMNINNGLLTIDRVWQLDDTLLLWRSKDLCLAFALFKMLRCRFASIGYCLFVITFLVTTFRGYSALDYEQIYCHPVHCHPVSGSTYTYRSESKAEVSFGRLLFDFLPVCLLGTLGVLVEAREIASYICSNWTKVALICGYRWEDKMYQCSILVLHPSRNPIALLRRILHLPDLKMKIPRAVNAAVLDVLRNNGATPRQLQVGSDLLWTFHEAKGAADAMLVCHVATSILVMTRSREQLPSDHEIVATHLSRYCAYLVACCPKLLPDDHVWCRSLYKAVKKDAGRVLAGHDITVSSLEAEHRRLVELLRARSKHQVLKDGAELGQRLAELPEGEEVAWKALAGFWTEMIVSVAATRDNIDEHAEAVARGGELVTLLWALLAHVGSVDDYTAAATHGAPDVV